MTIPWMYLDKRAASIGAVKDFPLMRHILDNYSDDIGESKAHLTTMHKPVLGGMPGAINPKAHESHLVSTLDLIDVIEKRYAQAIEYMAWFLPAWNALSEEERHLLTMFYEQKEKSIAVVIKDLCEELGYERSSVYRMRDKALDHITLLLYGK